MHITSGLPLAAGEVLVTGAGGFIGGEVARLLAAQPGLRVRAATRDGRALGAGLEPWRLDICNPAAMAPALQGVAAVVHCAVGDRRTTVQGTRLLLAAARAAGVRRFIHFSSVAVYRAAVGEVMETAPLVSPAGLDYPNWKAAAEAACREAAQAGMQTVLLRPAIVYGPGSRDFVLQPAQRLLAGGWGTLGALGQGICNLVHVRDVAQACLAALRAPDPAGGEAFNLSGPESLTWDGWYARLAQALGCPPLATVAPGAWRRRATARLACRALARLLPAAGPRLTPLILAAPTHGELALFARAATYPAGKAAAQLGWQPRVGLAEGLAESVAWLRSEGLAA